MKELFELFLRLGLTAFGGPAAHIVMMRNEVVRKKQWMNDAEFLNLVGLTNLIPGPNSTELAIHIGHERRGLKGLIVAGFCFIVPAVMLTAIFAYLYSEYGTLPQVQPFIYGIRAAVTSVVAMVVLPLFKTAAKNNQLKIICVGSFLLSVAGCNEILVMFGVGLGYTVYHYFMKDYTVKSVFLPPLVLIPRLGNIDIFLYFVKIGSILYGSGYVLFSFIDDELVGSGILTRAELIDAISVGQFTPGPVFSSVTFIGYQLNGFSGALMATLGVFVPSFIFVWLLIFIKGKVMQNTMFTRFLDAVNVISVALIAYVCWSMVKDTVTDWRTIFISATSFAVMWCFPKINSALIIVYGSIAGYVLLVFL